MRKTGAVNKGQFHFFSGKKVNRPLFALVLLLSVAFSSACSENIKKPAYDFYHPDKVYELPDSLSEISGLTLLDNDHLGAVHDESNKIFVIDVHTGTVIDWHKMGKRRDYEGIERVGDTVYVLTSRGTIHEIQDWQHNKRITAKYKTGLRSKHDNEGLAYDAVNHRLLIVCKEYPGKKLKGYKAVYSFDLERKRLLPQPVFLLDLAGIEQLAKSSNFSMKKNGKGWKKSKKQFKPAALAVHPLTQQLFVISSVKRRLVILDSDGALHAVYKLPKDIFVQAEGLAFLPNGDLFISNERANRKTATLLRFNYK